MVDDSFEKGTKRFCDWIQTNFDYVSTSFAVTDLRAQSEGRGLIATKDIAKGDILFEFTRDKIINVDSATLASLHNGANKRILIELGQWEALILCLSYELMLGPKSRWWNYIQILPQEVDQFHTLIFWKDDELAYLKPSCVLERIGKDSAQKMYNKLIPEYCNKLGVPEMAKFLTIQKFYAVASLIMSYSFDVDHAEEVEDEENESSSKEENESGDHDDDNSGDDDDNDDDDDSSDDLRECVRYDSYLKSMVPLADTLNANTTYVNATLHYDHVKLAMKAIKDIKKGEQIFNTYGDLPDSEILRKYGYIELPSSAAEFADVPLKSVVGYYKKKFTEVFPVIKNINLVVDSIIELITESEYLDETLIDCDGGIVIDMYEVYSKGQLIPEFILLLLILSTLLNSFKTDPKWFKRLARHVGKHNSDFEIFVNRTIVKCYQLLEERSLLTSSFMVDLKGIMKERIAEYPSKVCEDDYKQPTNFNLSMTKQDIANVILRNEVQCLQDIVNGSFPPHDEKTGDPKFVVISDDKFLKNVLKRKLEEDGRRHKRKRRD